MESINLNNYEAYFLDFLEGTLSAKDEEALYSFLDTHPHLKSEFVDLTGMSINELTLSATEPSSISTMALKADPSVLSHMTVDEWMVSSVENQLSESQNAQLLNFIAQHKLESKFVAYQATILSPQAGDVYGDKGNLKRKPATVIPLWVKIGSAAAAVALIVFFINPNTGENEVAEEVSTGVLAPKAIDFKNYQAGIPRAIQVNDIENMNDQQMPERVFREDVVQEDKNENSDSSKTILLNIELPDEIVEEDPIDTAKNIIQNPIPDVVDENIAVIEKSNGNKTVEEEPYRLFTDAASNVTNRKVSFTRTLNTESDEYVAYHFKIGKFEFDRKKSSK